VAEPAGLFGPVFARGRVDTGDDAWLTALLVVEAALARALERAGMAEPGAGAAVTAVARPENFDRQALGREAAQTGNPVPALVRVLRRLVPPAAAAAVHHGATSQDIIDTAAMLLARDALTAIGQDLRAAAEAAGGLAARHRGTLMIGRTLLQQAVPITFGLVAAGWLTALDESAGAVHRVLPRLAVQFGGAAGTLAPLGQVGPGVVVLLAEELGLSVPILPWHTDRSRIAQVAAACGLLSGTLGKIARDVTLLAQSEVGEVREGGPYGGLGDGGGGRDPEPAVRRGMPPGGEAPFPAHHGTGEHGDGTRRGGSSAMPHKHNPVAAIAVLGCTRQIPGLVATLLASAEQEHQRAAGAWHAEWLPFSQMLARAGSAACWGAELLAGLIVDPARMRANVAASRGLPLAERVAGLLTPALGRTAAHDLLARASARALADDQSLGDALLADPDLRAQLDAGAVTADAITGALDPASYLGAVGVFVDAALAAHQNARR
jgi:3-carboxy-cis,cis-muconate cycloisomerase